MNSASILQAAEARDPAHAPRILIVDDVSRSAAETREALIATGIKPSSIVEANAFSTAVVRLQQSLTIERPFDIIVLDLYMEGDLFAGFELADYLTKKYLPKCEPTRRPKVFIYSRFRDFVAAMPSKKRFHFEKLLTKVEHDVVTKVFAKPSDMNQLIQEIRKIVPA